MSKTGEQRSAAALYSFDELRRNVPTSSAPPRNTVSLAHFMGSRIEGPLLNKSSLPMGESATTSESTFLARGVPLPGLTGTVRDRVTTALRDNTVARSNESARALLNRPNRSEQQSHSDPGIPRTSSPLKSTASDRTAEADYSNDGMITSREAHEVASTASLMRLRAPDVVRQRLHAATISASQVSSAPARSSSDPSPIPPPTRTSAARGSALTASAQDIRTIAQRPGDVRENGTATRMNEAKRLDAMSPRSSDSLDWKAGHAIHPYGTLSGATGQHVLNVQTINLDAPSLYEEGQESRTRQAQVWTCAMSHPSQEFEHEAHVFYRSEGRIIFHQADHLSGPNLWVWQPSLCSAEQGRIIGLESRYGIRAAHIEAGHEPSDMVACLGGQLVTRDGIQEDFDPQRNALYRVQARTDIIFIDEVKLAVSSLCSGFAYVLSLGPKGRILVWLGIGSTQYECAAAETFAQGLAGAARSTVTVEQERGEIPALIRQTCGSSPHYASARHWRFRQADTPPPRLYTVSSPIDRIPLDQTHIVDLFFEIYIIVPAHCSITKELDKALELASQGQRPFMPPVHVLRLPSLIPLDLAAALRTEVWPMGRQMRLYTIEEWEAL